MHFDHSANGRPTSYTGITGIHSKIKIVWPAQVISEHKDILPELELFQRYCNQLGIPPLKAGSTTQQALVLKLDQQMAPEAYAFKSLPNGSVELRGRRDGVFAD
ncbi:MAG: hypothetical protein HWD58_02580 [Bacteroidota bacterium]|nr:MAG: hypothetical protein HWD58_02580 [Bacteroidota bacterium]